MAGALPFRSPWIDQLHDTTARPLTSDLDADVAVIGAGIAGLSTAFHLIRHTTRDVLLIEAGEVGRGATGRNAGQLVTYTERPLHDIADEYGDDMAIAGQQELETGWALLREMAVAARVDARIEQFTGHMGMLNLNHAVVHLRNNALRRRGGLEPDRCVVSEDAEFLDDIPDEFAGQFEVVPQSVVRDLLATDDDRFRAVLSHAKGVANGALICEQVLDHLERTHADRFRYVDHSPVQRIVLDTDAAALRIGPHTVRARSVVLCTNGFVDHEVENRAGVPIEPWKARVIRTVGFMVGKVDDEPPPCRAISYIRNTAIGDDLVPYVYVTARPYDRGEHVVGLTCVGGPEAPIDEVVDYDAAADVPADVVAKFEGDVRALAFGGRADGAGYDYAWHGVMGYTESLIRWVGVEPRNRVLLYNLGCNGVGFLPSIVGGRRIARILAGEHLAPSIFDPT